MGERRPVVANKSVAYSGLFNAKDLWRFIDGWFADNGYGDRIEIYHEEKVHKTHKDIEVLYQPYLKMSDYVKVEIRMVIQFSNLIKKTITKDGHKINTNQGDVYIQFDGYINTDYEGRWGNTAGQFFWRTILDKFVFKTYNSKYDKIIADHIEELKSEIKSFLNMNKY